jgi:hypothetical protein
MAEHLLVSGNLFCTGWEILTFSCRFYTPTNRDKLSDSGLEETMVNAYETIRQTMRSTPGVTDLRTAAFVSVINKIAISYMELGIFP